MQGYLVRHTGKGVVLRRDLLEQALDLADWPLLRLAVDPRSGEPLLDRLPRDLPLWDDPGPDDPEAARRERLAWWTRPDRSAALHDLAPAAPARVAKAAPKPAKAPAPAAPTPKAPRAADVPEAPTPGRAKADALRALRARHEALQEGLRALVDRFAAEEPRDL